ncbi:MAG: hypothetical protein LBV01_06185 [Deltaproteobacteria bacterium]|jgi:hypothetical protein|nr:hypothetical protein [Deltaproteobacteria bacterium]
MRALFPTYRSLGRAVAWLPITWLPAALLFVGLAATEAQGSKSIEGTVPQAASAMARTIDRQVAERLMLPDSPASGVSLAVTVPVDVNDLDASNPLARQMAEELARWFVQAGYHVQEIRKGSMVLIEPGNGEKLLTRRDGLLANKSVESAAIVTGTYVVTGKNVRFNIRMLQTATQDVLGMAQVSVPITSEVRALLGEGGAGNRSFSVLSPNVGTTLP